MLFIQHHELLVKILVNFHIVEVLQAPFLVKLAQPEPLVFFREFRCASNGATFEVESKLIVLLVIWVASVLHDDYVQRFEKLGLDGEDTIYSC